MHILIAWLVLFIFHGAVLELQSIDLELEVAMWNLVMAFPM